MQQHLLDTNSNENAFCYSDSYWNVTSSNTAMKEIEGKCKIVMYAFVSKCMLDSVTHNLRKIIRSLLIVF